MNHADRSKIEERIVVAWREAVQSLFLQDRFYERTDHLAAGDLVTVYMILEALIPLNIVEPELTSTDLNRLRSKQLERAFTASACCGPQDKKGNEKFYRIRFQRLREIAEGLVSNVKLPGATSLEDMRDMLFTKPTQETVEQSTVVKKPEKPKSDRSTTQPFAYDQGFLASLQEAGSASVSREQGRNMEHSTMRPASAFANPSADFQKAVGANKKPQR